MAVAFNSADQLSQEQAVLPIAGLKQSSCYQLRERLGVCQWFHFQDKAEVSRTLHCVQDLGLKHLRTGLSWADYHRPGGKRWYRWLIRELSTSGLDVLFTFWATPTNLSENGLINGPPKILSDYARMIEDVCDTYDANVTAVQFWNEPNCLRFWDFKACDPEWRKYATMVRHAAELVKQRRILAVLGGMTPTSPQWLKLMLDYEVMPNIDVVAIHGFPGMWTPAYRYDWDIKNQWNGWPHKLGLLTPLLRGQPVWITETGLATWDTRRRSAGRFDLQAARLKEAIDATSQFSRIYWYSMLDLDPSYEAIEQVTGGFTDHVEYHMGLVTSEGAKKPAYFLLRDALRV